MVTMDNYQALGNAIVKQAARDYERCLVWDHKCSTHETKSSLRALERFFTGELISIYTKLDGVALMEAIKQQLIEYNYDLEALNEARHGFDEDEEEEA